jgi:hypothetical protein
VPALTIRLELEAEPRLEWEGVADYAAERRRDGTAELGLGKLAESAGVSKDTARQARRTLASLGYLAFALGGGRTRTTYRALVPRRGVEKLVPSTREQGSNSSTPQSTSATRDDDGPRGRETRPQGYEPAAPVGVDLDQGRKIKSKDVLDWDLRLGIGSNGSVRSNTEVAGLSESEVALLSENEIAVLRECDALVAEGIARWVP